MLQRDAEGRNNRCARHIVNPRKVPAERMHVESLEGNTILFVAVSGERAGVAESSFSQCITPFVGYAHRVSRGL